MKLSQIAVVAMVTFIFAACAASKKKHKIAPPAPPVAPAVTSVPAKPIPDKSPDAPASSPASPFLFSKPADGIYAPGNDELAAIEPQYKGLKLEKLKEGYVLYAQGACTNCHNAKPIYPIPTSEWGGIIDDMSEKAMLTSAQKDAVYKYVLSIKATQPK
ncbi:hypothetical protein CJD36_012595 [Flavipsychrobacter stenotrophus]|uniref:Cytochrome c domain-containing protein n=1 Tax=Flavipsychrobacter stenotrophus TaxID=2077091 RepID=A0A2S7SV37_9BACT|nr:hypothetical protein [Flavipsychrobacter stenotrophus]PQJ10802.1 hypothetical protein CJD36_012595 [Flavipsychrobacter stenotrophus]